MRLFPLLLVLTLAPTWFANAEPIRQPLDLNPGDQYRLAFVTSTTTTATSSDIETYNAFVQATANAAPIGEWGLTWKAIAQTESVTARENTQTTPSDPSVPIYLLDGGRLVDSYEVLWMDPRRNASREDFAINEFGEIQNEDRFGNGLEVWTGTGEDGLTSQLFGTLGPIVIGPLGSQERSVVGLTDTGSTGWFSSQSALTFQSELPLYAISETLTAVPEPSSCVLAILAFALYRILLPREIHNRRPTLDSQVTQR